MTRLISTIGAGNAGADSGPADLESAMSHASGQKERGPREPVADETSLPPEEDEYFSFEI